MERQTTGLDGNEIRLLFAPVRLQWPLTFHAFIDPSLHCADGEKDAAAHCNCTATAATALQLPSSERHHFFLDTTLPSTTRCPPFPCSPALPLPPVSNNDNQHTHHHHHLHTTQSSLPPTRVVADLSLQSRPDKPFATTDQRLSSLQSLLFLASDSRPQVPPLIPRLRPMRSLAR